MRNQLTSEDIFFLNVEKERIKSQIKIYIDEALDAYFSEQNFMAGEPKRLFVEFIAPELKNSYGWLLDECVKFMLGESNSLTFMLEEPDIPTLDKCMVESLRGLIITGFNEYERDLEDARRKQAQMARKQQAEMARKQQAEIARKQQAAFTPISKAIVNNIATLVDGNNASYEDVVNTGFESENATIEIYVKWGFAWDHDHISIPGGNSASIHFGNDLHKFNAHAKASRAKIDHAYYISSYLDSIEAKASAGMLEVNTRQHTIFTGKYFSYRCSCDSCAGRGSVSCSGCGGGGRMTCPSCSGGGIQSYLQPVTSSNGQPNGSVTRYVPCTGCSGTCTVVCYTCGGGGRTNCGSCSAYGWFLISKRILLIGKPSYSVAVSGDIQSIKLRDTILENLNINSIYKLTSYSTTRIADTNTYKFLYSGKTEVLKQCFSVKSLPYCIYTYSNPPVTFLTAHFFDDLFEKQLQTARTLKGIGAAEKSTLIRYIAELNEIPLLKKNHKINY